MSNTYFQFKQFTVQQDRCAMKVSTDACLFGAWAAEKINTLQLTCRTILDIGAGTGLLSLMLAQKTGAMIDAVELDRAAAYQARENVQASAWGDRIQVIQADIKTYSSNRKYDLIISNPPFFEKSLLSPDKINNQAKHSQDLTLQQLMQAAGEHLEATGHVAVLLPWSRMDYLVQTAIAEGFNLVAALLVSHSPAHPFFRSCLFLNRFAEQEVIREEMSIKNENRYTERFTALLEDYYLYL